MASTTPFSTNLLRGENVQTAQHVANDKLEEIKKAAKDGDFSLRLMALIGGVATIFTSGLQIFSEFINLNLVGTLVDIYVLLLGFVVLLLEARQLKLPQSIILRLHKYALFLRFLWGRGLLYSVTGTLLLTDPGFLNYVVGTYMCFVGIAYIVVGHRTATKLKEFRRSLFSEKALRSKFDEANTDGTGLLNLKQFAILIESLGLDMTKREVEAAFLYLDVEDKGKLDYETFRSWWVNCDEDTLDSSMI